MLGDEFIKKPKRLFEIDMSPSALKSQVKNIPAMVGMEFELLFRNFPGKNEPEQPNYDINPKCDSLASIKRFFTQNGANTPGVLQLILEYINDKFDSSDDYKTSLKTYWQEKYLKFIKRMILADKDKKKEIEEKGLSLNKAAEESYKNNDQYAQQARLNYEHSDDWINYGYLDARDDYVARNYTDMRSVEQIFSLNWPLIKDTRLESLKKISATLQQLTGKTVKYGLAYHSVPRDQTSYIIEPDGSIEPSNFQAVDKQGQVVHEFHGLNSDEAQDYLHNWHYTASQRDDNLPDIDQLTIKPIPPGQRDKDIAYEIISPPFELDELPSQLNAIYKFSEIYHGVTNNTTGLHINVSVKGIDINENIDFIKLLLLLGDDHVLEKFDRINNEYCMRSMTKLHKYVKDFSEDTILGIMDKMRTQINQLASKAVYDVAPQKYGSVNPNITKNYIEFRSPGGEWLKRKTDIVSTINRFVVAYAAAADPNLHARDYQQRLYKLLAPKKQELTIARLDKKNIVNLQGLFAKIQSGMVSRNDAIHTLQKYKMARARDNEITASGRQPSEHGPGWYRVFLQGSDNPASKVLDLTAETSDKALAEALQLWGRGSSSAMPTRQPEVKRVGEISEYPYALNPQMIAPDSISWATVALTRTTDYFPMMMFGTLQQAEQYTRLNNLTDNSYTLRPMKPRQNPNQRFLLKVPSSGSSRSSRSVR